MAGGDLSTVHDQVIEFLVEQGSAAAGRVDTASGSVTAGDATVAAQLAAVSVTSPGVPTVVDVGESVPIAAASLAWARSASKS